MPHNQRRNWKLRPKIGLVAWDESVLFYHDARHIAGPRYWSPDDREMSWLRLMAPITLT